jgi:hypothetical protein
MERGGSVPGVKEWMKSGESRSSQLLIIFFTYLCPLVCCYVVGHVKGTSLLSWMVDG